MMYVDMPLPMKQAVFIPQTHEEATPDIRGLPSPPLVADMESMVA
jgi:hypothetical protein